jgi:hypothetical protein
MNPVESGNVAISTYDSSSISSTAQGVDSQSTSTTSSSNPAVSSATTVIANTNAGATNTPLASALSPELQAVKSNDPETMALANGDYLKSMNKIIDALVGVVTTLVSLVTNIMSNFNRSAPVKNPPFIPMPTYGNAAGAATGTTPNQVRSALDVTRSDAGMIAVRTLDGFVVRAEGRDQAWSITGPDGKTTRIWGDPHVTESDGDKWDFLNRATFMFGKNKATVEVVPAGNGQTLSARLTIYSDYERVTIDGIDKDKPSITAASTDGLQHDASLADGEIYKRALTANGEAWISKATGKIVPVKR